VELGEALRRFRDPLADGRDRALATDLVIGTLRWRGAIDYQLQQRSAKALHRLDDDVLEALRLGAYQLMYLARVPVSAVVNDAVAIVKASRLRSATGFVNAILRRLVRERDNLEWPTQPTELDSQADREALIDYLAVRHSHPAWLVARWIDRYGPADTEAWLAFNNRVPATRVAPNRLRTSQTDLAARLRAEGVETLPTPVAPYGLTVTAGNVLTTGAFREGDCVIQDEASQIVAELVTADDGDRVLDACASPGGKTLALAAQVAPSGHVVAADVRRRRVALLADTLRRCHATGVRIVHASTAGPLPFQPGSFDRVLVDAPCSGLGTVRRDPDIRWRRHAEDLSGLATAQHELLTRVAAVVAPGGRVIYSTCSSEPDENEAVVAAFLAEAPDFSLVPVSRLPDLAAPIRAMATADGYLRTTPLHGLEAFFGAILEKRGVAT